jgi:A/G-specific adenine glycosylase
VDRAREIPHRDRAVGADLGGERVNADGDFVWTPREGLGALPSVFLKAALAGERLI